MRIDDAEARPNEFVYLGTDREGLELILDEGSRLLLLGGQPFAEEIAMWWNFVARDQTELARAFADWRDGSERFGPVETLL